MIRKTKDAARELGMTITRLRGMLETQKIAPPRKDSSGDYVWDDADLDRVRQAAAVDRRRKQS
jgi:hypothetical protein